MGRQRFFMVLVVVVVGWVLVPAGRVAADQVIAEFDVFDYTGSWFVSPLHDSQEWIAQTFKATTSARADSVDLVLESDPANNPDNLPLRVQLRTTYVASYNGIVPSDNIIAEGSIAHDDSRFTGSLTWKNIDLTPVDLVAGESYAIVIKTDNLTDEAYDWYGKWQSGQDPYPDGREVIMLTVGQWNFSSGDLAFRVNSSVVPEPCTMVLLSLGGAGLLLHRRHRR